MASPATQLDTRSARAAALVRTFQAALAALDDFKAKSPGEAADIYAHVAAHLRSAAPMALVGLPLAATAVPAAMPVAPVAVVASESPAEGAPTDVIVTSLTTVAFYELSTLRREAALGDGVNLYLHDDAGHDANVVLTPTQAGAFGRDFQRVLARLAAIAKQRTP